MNIEVVKNEKNDMEVKLDSVTVAELLRVYLNNVSGVDFAAWRREHITSPALLKIQTSGKTAKKALGEAISAVNSDTSKFLSELK